MAKIELVNSDIVSAQLLGIPGKIRTAVERKALTEANKLTAGRLRQNVPVEFGALKRSIKDTIRKCKGGDVLIGRIGADYNYVGGIVHKTTKKPGQTKKVFKRNAQGKSNVRRPAKYIHLVDLGTKRGITAMRFREKTVQQLKERIQQIFTDAVQAECNQ